MYKLIFMACLIFSQLTAIEWINCNREPYPAYERVIFYEEITKTVFLECPAYYRFGFFYNYQQYPCISHWARIPPKPSECVGEWISCEDKPIDMDKPCIFYDKTMDNVFIDIPYEYSVVVGHMYEQIPNLTHWQKLPSAPIEDIKISER